MALSPGARLGPYEIVAALGAGGMGEVYRARDARLGRSVAIKILRPQPEGAGERRRLLQEARAVSALNHPHIVTLHDIGEHDGQDYLVMECIEGAPLGARIGSRGLPIGEVLAYGVAIAAGVAAAHAAGILHRDLKPSNILVTADGTVKVVDFGLAKLPSVAVAAEDATVTAAPTLAGALVGTPAYMSPEQVAAKPLDVRSDVFSFGAVLYEMVTGTRAFQRESSTETLVAVLHDEPRAVRDMRPDIPPALERLIQRCLRKDPSSRLASMREVGVLLEDLREALHTPTGRRAPIAEPGGRQARRPLRAALVAAAVILLTLLGLGTARYVWRSPATPLTGVASIVALPSTVFGDAEFEYLADAVPATLSTHLAQIDGLDTKVPPSSLDVEQVRGDLGRIASAYGVTAFVVSSVLADRDRLVLNVQLVESRTRRVAWSRQYEGTRQAYINLVNEAADGLRVALRPATASVRVQTAPAAASEAELALRQGQYYSNRYNNHHHSADFERAFASLQEALRLEPTLAQAAAEIAALVLYRSDAGAVSATVNAEAEVWARRALALDPQNAQAWASLTWIEFTKPDGSLATMLEYGLRAAAFGPRCSTCQQSLVFVGFASTELARAPLRAARALDPLFLYPILNLSKAAADLGQATEALTLLDEAAELEPDAPYVLQGKALILAALGRLDEAAVALERLRVHANERRIAVLHFQTAEHAVARGRADTASAEAALAAIMKTLNDPASSMQDLLHIQGAVVPVLARTGLVDTALDIIERAARAGTIMPYDWFLVNPDLEPLRHDRRFQAVAAQARAQAETLIAILFEAQRRGELPEYLEQPLADFSALLATGRGR